MQATVATKGLITNSCRWVLVQVVRIHSQRRGRVWSGCNGEEIASIICLAKNVPGLWHALRNHEIPVPWGELWVPGPRKLSKRLGQRLRLGRMC